MQIKQIIKKDKKMLNIQMTLTALERYASYLYYAYSSDSLRPEDCKNLVDFIDTALQTLIFTDPEIEAINYDIASALNRAQTYAHSLSQGLQTYLQPKTVYYLIDQIYKLSFFPGVELLKDEVKKI